MACERIHKVCSIYQWSWLWIKTHTNESIGFRSKIYERKCLSTMLAYALSERTPYGWQRVSSSFFLPLFASCRLQRVRNLYNSLSMLNTFTVIHSVVCFRSGISFIRCWDCVFQTYLLGHAPALHLTCTAC